MAAAGVAVEPALDGSGARVAHLLFGAAALHGSVEQGGGVRQAFDDGAHHLAAEIGRDVVGLALHCAGGKQTKQRQMLRVARRARHGDVVEVPFDAPGQLDGRCGLPEAHGDARRVGREAQHVKARVVTAHGKASGLDGAVERAQRVGAAIGVILGRLAEQVRQGLVSSSCGASAQNTVEASPTWRRCDEPFASR
jgi:hypothetical protein